jgi:hypothetical protein
LRAAACCLTLTRGAVYRTAEYNALKWFAVIVPVYYAVWVGLASFFLSFYFSVSDSARDELRLYDNNPVWYACARTHARCRLERARIDDD